MQASAINSTPHRARWHTGWTMIALRRRDSRTGILPPDQVDLPPQPPSATLPFPPAPALRRPPGNGTDDTTHLYHVVYWIFYSVAHPMASVNKNVPFFRAIHAKIGILLKFRSGGTVRLSQYTIRSVWTHRQSLTSRQIFGGHPLFQGNTSPDPPSPRSPAPPPDRSIARSPRPYPAHRCSGHTRKAVLRSAPDPTAS